MVEWTFCEEPAGWSCASSVSRDHDSRSCSRSTERDWMPDANRFARNDHRFLRRCRFSHRPHCTLLRTTNGQGLRRRSRASSVLLARASRNLPARPVTSSTAILAVGLAGILPAKKVSTRRDARLPSQARCLCYYFLPIFAGKSQRSFPSSDSGSTSTSATPALDSLSDAPVNPEITLVKSGS